MKIVPHFIQFGACRFAVDMKRGLFSIQIDDDLFGAVNRQVVAN